MVKRALCVGCNYPSKAFGLAGAVNDAFLIAETLQVGPSSFFRCEQKKLHQVTLGGRTLLETILKLVFRRCVEDLRA